MPLLKATPRTNYNVKIAVIAMTIFTALMFFGYIILSIVSGGACPHFEGLESFEVDRYKGVWYELQRDTNIRFETGECITAQYETYDKNPAYVSVENTEYWPDRNEYAKINGYAVASNWYPGDIGVYFFGGAGADYRVVSTD